MNPETLSCDKEQIPLEAPGKMRDGWSGVILKVSDTRFRRACKSVFPSPIEAQNNMFDNGTVITDQGYMWHCWLFGERGVVRVSPEALSRHRHEVLRHAQYAFANFPCSFTEAYRSGDVVIHRWKNRAGQDIVTIDTIDSDNCRRGVRFVAEDGQNRITLT